ncbi:MAG: hypothetical protein KGJ23_08345 [Euryarchaeota archaeon]|nr:hypothetical protein [Euryarchaeota archaeon]MDE1836612.1 hypothetical protein [Euryarchaeota archaeon]MDE1879193.1 hypothetical protein [Euryarchaeota archaeon]MDE2044582.1 hypothetical protein [Thermoplasmata archaeon]
MSNNNLGDMAEDSVLAYAGLNPTAKAYQSYVDISIADDGVSVQDQPEASAPGGSTGYAVVNAADNTSGAAPPKTYHTNFGWMTLRSGEVVRVFYDFQMKTVDATLRLTHASATATPGGAANFKQGDSVLVQKGKWGGAAYKAGTTPTGTLKAHLGATTSEGATGVVPKLDQGTPVNVAAGEDIAVVFGLATAPAQHAVGVYGLHYIGLSTAVV